MIKAARHKKVALFDIDGTLIDVSMYRHHVVKGHPLFSGKRDFDKFHKESMNAPVIKENIAILCEHYYSDDSLVAILTSRKSKWRDDTIKYLEQNNIPYHALYMRAESDGRPAHEVKEEFVISLKELGFDVMLGVDDDPSVIEMYNRHGVPSIRVQGWMD